MICTRHIDENALCLDLLLADWTPVQYSETTTAKWRAFLQIWDPIINRHIPMKTIKVTRRRRYPWLSDDDVKRAMTARNRAKTIKDRSPSEQTVAELP